MPGSSPSRLFRGAVTGSSAERIGAVGGGLIVLGVLAGVLGVGGWAVLGLVLAGGAGLSLLTRWNTSKLHGGAGAVVLVASVAGIGLLAVRDRAPAVAPAAPVPSPAPVTRLAYTTPDGVFLATPGSTAVVRLSTLRSGELVTGLSWSPDGRYLAGTLRRPDGVSRAWAYDTRTKRPLGWPECECSHTFFVGTDLVAVESSEVIVYPLTLGKPHRFVPTEVDLRTDRVLGATSDGLVVARADAAAKSAHGGPEEVFLLEPDGTTRLLFGTDSTRAISLQDMRNDGDYLAWRAGADCADDQSVRAVRTADGSSFEIARPDESAWAVVALRWSRLASGWELFSVQYPTGADRCAVGQPRLFRSAPGGRWAPVDAPEGVKDAAVSPSGVLAVRIGGLGVPDGQLTLVDAGARQPVADRVLEMAWSS